MMIVVSGSPASGKTTLSHALSSHFSLPILSSDKLGEWLYDDAKVHDIKTRHAISAAAYSLMFRLIEEFLQHKSSFIVESCFHPELAAPQIKKIMGDQKVLEVFLFAPNKDLIVERYKKRMSTPGRHAAHRDSEKVDHLRRHMDEVDYQPIAVGKYLKINTHSCDRVIDDAIEFIQKNIATENKLPGV